ncbi:hypothetical protein DFH29DRAFT_873451 [Suillus ampliporus]|nr:hypothetical protein DFH29DRAFT_873451 [Suillus ampliporus]
MSVVQFGILGTTLLSEYAMALRPTLPVTTVLVEMYHQENNGLLADWDDQYGTTYIQRFFGECRPMTTNPTAVTHILDKSDIYHKPDFVRHNLAGMGTGELGVLIPEGGEYWSVMTHDIIRYYVKVCCNVVVVRPGRTAPAFTAAHIKTLYPVFWAKANQLRDVWIQAVK